jgi:hypothetical protein
MVKALQAVLIALAAAMGTFWAILGYVDGQAPAMGLGILCWGAAVATACHAS